MDLEFQLQLKSWYARAPSASNLADDPSRLKFDLLLSLGARPVEIDWRSVLGSSKEWSALQRGEDGTTGSTPLCTQKKERESGVLV